MDEWPPIVELLSGRSTKRILLYEGESGFGKSALVRQAALYAKLLSIPVVSVDFKGGTLAVPGILEQFDLDIGFYLPNFSNAGANRTTHLLRKDLRSLLKPILVIFDSYEDAVGNKEVTDWLNQQFLNEVETAVGLAVIVAGQKVPDYSKAGWSDSIRHLKLKPIIDIEHWKPWVDQHYPKFWEKGADLKTVLMVAGGNPLTVRSACEAISKS
jgi:hypothetical protein